MGGIDELENGCSDDVFQLFDCRYRNRLHHSAAAEDLGKSIWLGMRPVIFSIRAWLEGIPFRLSYSIASEHGEQRQVRSACCVQIKCAKAWIMEKA